MQGGFSVCLAGAAFAPINSAVANELDRTGEGKMMKPAVFALTAFVAMGMTGSAWAAQVTPRSGAVVSTDKPADKQIEKQIKADPLLKQDDIHVSVRDNVVTLSGTVATDAERARAAEVAKVAGVARVDNQILVDPYAKPKGTTGKIEDKSQ